MISKTKQQNNPEGWTIYKVSDVFNFVRTYAFSREKLINGTHNNEGIGNIHYGDIHSTYTSTNLNLGSISVPMIIDRSLIVPKEDLLKDGDLVMADVSEDYAGVGVAISVHGIENKKVIGGLHTYVLRDLKNKTEEYFRQYIFLNPEIRNVLQKVANGVSVYGISKTAVSKISLAIPPLPEQKRIVAVLRTWDQAIENLKQKIEIKKEIKKGLMQGLLTGKKRLSGFKDEWKTQSLSNLGTFSKGAGILKDQVIDSGINAVRYGELYTKYNYQIKYIHSHIPPEVVETTKKIKYGDILFAGSGETIDEIGKSAAYLLNEECYAGGDTIVFTPKKSDSLFLSYFLNVGESRKKMREVGQGQSVVHIYKSDLEKMELHIPTIDEQRAIAKVLDIATTEIEVLIEKCNLYKEQKKHLLNNLITGTIRTPENLLAKIK